MNQDHNTVNNNDLTNTDDSLVDKPNNTTESHEGATGVSSANAQKDKNDKKITRGLPMPMLLIGAAVLGVLAVMLLMPKKQSTVQHKADKVQFVPTFDTQGQSSDIEMKLASKQAASDASLKTDLTHLKEQVSSLQAEMKNAKNQSQAESQVKAEGAFPAKSFTPINPASGSLAHNSHDNGNTRNPNQDQTHNNVINNSSNWNAPHGMTPMSGATTLSAKSLSMQTAGVIMPQMQVFAVDYASGEPADPYKDYVPAATIVRAVVVTGADANAGVGSQGDTVPMLFRLLDKGTEANDVKANLKGCFITGQTYGDISSDRGHVRLDRLACNHKDGTKLDIPVYGAAFGNGIEGIWGQEADRSGPVLWRSGISGFMQGFANALQNAQTTQNQSVLGTTTTVSPTSSLKFAALGGGSKAFGNLSSYYIQLANQYHPIIQLSAGTVVYIVFTRGFSTNVTQTITVPTPIKSTQAQTNPYGFASAPQTQSWQQPDTSAGLSLPATLSHE